MPKFISNERLAFLTGLESVTQAMAGADVNLEECADAEALTAALATEQPDLQAIGDSACDTLLASAGITGEDEASHEDVLAAFVGSHASAVADHDQLTDAITAAGLTLPEASADAPLTAEGITASLTEQLEKMIVNKSIGIAAAAGATTDETPETSETDTTPQTSSEIVAHYNTLAGTDRTEYFAANKAAIMAALTA